MLSVEFLTDPDVVAEVLPPPLPTHHAACGRWQSNCVGDFFGGAIYVAARHDGIDGAYVLAMYMDNDQPTIYGRDLFGEPKKLATSALHRHGGLPRLARARRRAPDRAAVCSRPISARRSRRA